MAEHVFANNRLRVSVTDSCNLACSYCTNEGQQHNKNNYLDVAWFESLISRIESEEIYVRKLNLTGGEPLLHRQLERIISLARRISSAVTLNTNGILLNLERTESLASLGLANIKFGADWLFAERTKPSHRGSRVDMSQYLEVIRRAIELMPRSSLNVVISNFNAESIDKMIHFVIEERIDKVEFLELIEHDFRHTGEKERRRKRIHETVSEFCHLFSNIEYNYDLAKYMCMTNDGLMVQFAEDFCQRRVCQNLWTRIDSKGRFSPCIKGGDFYPLDFNSPLAPQIRNANNLMCNGPGGHAPRNEEGQLLETGHQGKYLPTTLASLDQHKLMISHRDP